MRYLALVCFLILAGCFARDEKMSDVRYLSEVDSLAEAERWCDLRTFLVSSPDRLRGEDELATELRDFLTTSAARCAFQDGSSRRVTEVDATVAEDGTVVAEVPAELPAPSAPTGPVLSGGSDDRAPSIDEPRDDDEDEADEDDDDRQERGRGGGLVSGTIGTVRDTIGGVTDAIGIRN